MTVEQGPDGRTHTVVTSPNAEGKKEQRLWDAKHRAEVQAARALEAQEEEDPEEGTPPATTVLPTPSAAARAVKAAPPGQPHVTQQPLGPDVSAAFRPGWTSAVPVPAFAEKEKHSERTLPWGAKPLPANCVLRSLCMRLYTTPTKAKFLDDFHAAHRAAYSACAKQINLNRDEAVRSGGMEKQTPLTELRAVVKKLSVKDPRVGSQPDKVRDYAAEAAFKAAGACHATDKKRRQAGKPGLDWRLKPQTSRDSSVIDCPSRANGGPMGVGSSRRLLGAARGFSSRRRSGWRALVVRGRVWTSSRMLAVSSHLRR